MPPPVQAEIDALELSGTVAHHAGILVPVAVVGGASATGAGVPATVVTLPVESTLAVQQPSVVPSADGQQLPVRPSLLHSGCAAQSTPAAAGASAAGAAGVSATAGATVVATASLEQAQQEYE